VIASFEKVAKWYGAVVGLVDVDVEVAPGVTGLLGPNGAGKSTFLKLLTGQIVPSQGRVRLLGTDPFRDWRLHRRIGFCPEPDAFWEQLTGREFVRYLTRLHGVAGREASRRADEAIARVDLDAEADRPIRGYSKGMRQRIKLAQALAHAPEVIVLDEPLNGMDPVGRKKTTNLIRELGAQGVSVLVSSHILHEVEGMTRQVVLLYQGRVRAQGEIGEIRALLDRYPHKIRLRTGRPRDLARALLALERIVAVRVEEDSVQVETRDPDALFDLLPRLVLDEGLPVESLHSEDLSLDAVFEYLTA